MHLGWTAATDNGRVASYRVLRAGQRIASGHSLTYVDKNARPGAAPRCSMRSSRSISPATRGRGQGQAAARGAAAQARCRGHQGQARHARESGSSCASRARSRTPRPAVALRIGKGAWHACKAKPDGSVAVDLPARGTTPVTLSLRDSLGRTKLQTLRVQRSPRTGGIGAAPAEGRGDEPDLAQPVGPGAVAVASLLLALPGRRPQIPASGPELVARSGQFVILHADNRDGSATRRRCSSTACDRRPFKRPATSGSSPARACGSRAACRTARSSSATPSARSRSSRPRRVDRQAEPAPATETTAVVQFYFSGPDCRGLPRSPPRTMTIRREVAAGVLPRADLRRITFETTVFGARACHATRSPPPVGGPTLLDRRLGARGGSLDRRLPPAVQPPRLRVPAAHRRPAAGPASPRSAAARLGQRQVRGGRARARARPQPRHRARRRASPAAAGSPPRHGRHVLRRPPHYTPACCRSTRIRSTRWATLPVLRQMNMPHKLALGVLPGAPCDGRHLRRLPLAPMETPALVRTAPRPQARGRQLLRRVPPAGGLFDTQRALRRGRTHPHGIAGPHHRNPI